MNRQQRRAETRKIKAKNVMINPGVESVDRSKTIFCWRHNLQLDDIDHPTERDKKLIKSVTLKPFKSTDKYGNKVMGRSCPRCGNTVMLKSPLLDSTKESIIELPGEKDNAHLSLPDM